MVRVLVSSRIILDTTLRINTHAGNDRMFRGVQRRFYILPDHHTRNV